MLSRFWHARFWQGGKRPKIIAAVGAGVTALTTVAVILALVLPRGAHADVLYAGDTLSPTSAGPLNFGTVCANSSVTKGFVLAIDASGHTVADGSPQYAGSAQVNVRAVFVSDASLSVAGTPMSPPSAYPVSVGTIVMPSNWPSYPDGTLSDVNYPDGSSYSSGAVTAQVTLATGNAGTTYSGSILFQTVQGSTSLNATVPVTASVSACPDTTPPVLTLPGNLTAEATSAAGATVTYTASAIDNVDGPVTPVCTPASGSTFALGATTVHCSATDAHGNTANGSFAITVVDTTPPTITIGATNVTAEATGPAGATVSYTPPTATDAVSGTVPVTCTPTSGYTFALGTTTVNCSATDGAGNTATATFTVTVQDTTAPVLTLPSNVTVEATGPTGAAVTYSASATDLVDGTVPITCTPASGSTFALGTTTVHCSAADKSGNTATGSFTLTVADTTPPTLSLPTKPVSAEATGPSGAVVRYSASATDLVDGTVPITCTPASGSTFALGTTTVHCSAVDKSGNTANGTFPVTVVDTTPPALTLPANIAVPATSLSGAVASFTATATDRVDGAVTPACTPASGSTFPIGITTVTCTATDAHGNESMGSFTVRVTYQVQGFLPPLNSSPYAPATINWNSASAGGNVQLKFQIFAGSDQVTNTSVVQQPLTLTQVDCSTGSPGTVGSTNVGSGGLVEQGNSGKLVYSWATPQQSGACYLVTLSVLDGSATVPGTSIQAYFKLN